ncbi:copper chaperone PCu(A)C [Paracoccus sp. p4-l81]|uniref:copper chaperone PCu(A)C n=1 Tax=Paracoccus sp. p4-l81 TaxID=3342806 RepID=UPI0035B8EC72
MRKMLTLAAVAALTSFTALPGLAQDSAIKITDAYARVAGASAKAGAAFLVIENTGDSDDRLADAKSDVAAKVELHTHKADANGVMSMVHVPDGFAIPAHSSHALARGGDHVMFLGLNRQLNHGDKVTVTLVFEKAGEITLDVPVDLERKDGMPTGMQGMGAMDHGMHGMHGMAAPSN